MCLLQPFPWSSDPSFFILDYELMSATLQPCSWPASLVSLDLKLPGSWVTNFRGYWFLWWPRDSHARLSSSRLHKPTYQVPHRVPHAFCWLWSFQAGFLKPFPLTASLCLRNFHVTSAIYVYKIVYALNIPDTNS